jgi:hypothetical protein
MKLFISALCLFATQVWASPQLQCEFELNGHSETHVFKPVSDPYLAESVDIGGRFRFKAVVLTSANQVDLVNLYVSYQTRRQPIILQHAKFIKPTLQSSQQANSLTGRIALYSPFLGKELAYGCSLFEVPS